MDFGFWVLGFRFRSKCLGLQGARVTDDGFNWLNLGCRIQIVEFRVWVQNLGLKFQNSKFIF